jgi:hypothetical protein
LSANRDTLRDELAKLEKNPLLLALNVVDAGHVLEDAGDQLKSLSALVIERQEKGVLLLKLALKPFKADALVISAAVKSLSRNSNRSRPSSTPTRTANFPGKTPGSASSRLIGKPSPETAVTYPKNESIESN